jgi:glycerol kinase
MEAPTSQAPFIVAIDSSTSSTKLEIYGLDGKSMYTGIKEHQILSPQSGWAENDPQTTLDSLWELAAKANEKYPLCKASAIGITNQRETIVAWKKSSGTVLNNAVLWCDARTTLICEEMIAKYQGNRNHFKKITGLPISTYFSAFKIKWLLENIPEVKSAHEASDVYFGNINTWILWNLTEGKVLATDTSNASRTFLMDLTTCDYSEELLKEFGIQRSSLPVIRPTFTNFGVVSSPKSFMSGVEVHCMIGDQQAATFGHGLLMPGLAKTTYGTGAFLMINTGTDVVDSSGLVSSVYFQSEGSKPHYCLEGAIECGGNVLNWLKDSLKLFDDFSKINSEIPETNGGVYFVPAMGGLYSPFWENNAGSLLFGASFNTQPAHIFRATLEGIAYRTKDCLDSLASATDHFGQPIKLTELLVDGGLTRSQFLLEFQQQVVGLPLKVTDNPNCTVLGAAMGAAVSKGLISLQDVSAIESIKTEVVTSGKWKLQENYSLWKKLCDAATQLGAERATQVVGPN